jgi:tRNA pseudouridine38-40 synthase
MVRLKVTVSYDGSHYEGFQSQHHGRTIQDELQLALSRINKGFVPIVGSGRTDAGAHALGQIFHFDPLVTMTCNSWKKALNRLLPDDIYVKNVCEVHSRFHARHDAILKEYQYFLNQGTHNPLQINYCYQYGQKLQIEKMKEALLMFIGKHDFRNFCSNSEQENISFEREIISASIELSADIINFRFVGNGFLRYMVRFMVGALVAIGRGKLSLNECYQALHPSAYRATLPYKVPSCGLYLVRVEYAQNNQEVGDGHAC